MRRLALALAATLLAASASAEDPIGSGVGTQAGIKDNPSIDELIPLNESYDVPVTLEARSVTITAVRIKDRPSAAQVEVASSRSSVRPELEISMKSAASREVRVFVEGALEDTTGHALLTCKRAKNLDPGELEDLTCPNNGIYTRDWPRVKVFHLKVEVVNR